MKKLQRSDVKDLIEYEKVRESFRQEIIDLKKRRRITVGPYLSFIFEDRETVLFQIEEMIRAERIVHDEGIQEELDAYNPLIPDEGELSATMMIEITNKRRIKDVLTGFMGIDRGETVWLQFGDERVFGTFEKGRSNEENISAVHFVHFRFSPQQSRHFKSGEDQAVLYVKHARYNRRAMLSDETRLSLQKDLEP